MADFDPDAYLKASGEAPASFDPNAYLGITEQPQEQSPYSIDELGRQLGLTARAGVKGLSFLPNTVADALAGAANLGLEAVGSEARVPYLSKVQEQGLKDSFFPQPKPGLEEKVQTAASSVASLMTPGLKLPGAATQESTAGEIFKRGVSDAVAAASGSVVGEEASKKAYEITGSPWAALAAGLATGAVAGSLSGKLTEVSLGGAESKFKQLTGTEPKKYTIEDIRKRASEGYEAMKDANVVVRSQAVKDNLLPAITKELADNNFSPEIVASHDVLRQNLANLDKVLSEPYVNFDKLEKIRRSFSSLAAGKDEQAFLAKTVVGNIDSFFGNLSGKDILSLSGEKTADALKAFGQARTDWRNQARAQVIQDALDNAQAKIEGGKGNTSDIIRNNLIGITSNKKKMELFSTREQNVIKAAVNANDLEQLLSLMAKFNPQRSNLQAAIAAGSAAGVYANPSSVPAWTGLGASALGNLAERGLTAERVRTANDLISQIASGNLRTPRKGYLETGLFGASQGQ